MSNPAPHLDACARCSEPHPARIAGDGKRTYRHADGHAYQPAQTVPDVRLTDSAVAGFTSEMFGTLAECTTCGAAVINRRTSMQRHAQHHQEQP